MFKIIDYKRVILQYIYIFEEMLWKKINNLICQCKHIQQDNNWSLLIFLSDMITRKYTNNITQ